MISKSFILIQIPTLFYRANVEILLWGNEEQINHIQNKHGPFDFIIGSDLLYEPLNYNDLLKTIQNLSEQKTVTILAHPIRHLGEENFLQEAQRYFDVYRTNVTLKNVHVFQLKHR